MRNLVPVVVYGDLPSMCHRAPSWLNLDGILPRMQLM